ncbi:MAG: TlpA disulfide reductase family protein, partial [Myxococcota bacterium]
MTVLLALVTAASAEPPAPPPTARVATVAKVEPLGPIALRSKLFAGGKPKVVNFWATWCGPCVAEIPSIVAYARAHPEVEVVMVDLDLPSLRTGKVDPFLKSHGVVGITHYQLDHAEPAKAIYQVVPDFPDAVPITLVVDGEGAITDK